MKEAPKSALDKRILKCIEQPDREDESNVIKFIKKRHSSHLTGSIGPNIQKDKPNSAPKVKRKSAKKA